MLIDFVNEQTLSLQGLTSGENGGFEATFDTIVETESPNKLIDFQYHPDTISKYKKMCNFRDDVAVFKTTGRITAFNIYLFTRRVERGA